MTNKNHNIDNNFVISGICPLGANKTGLIFLKSTKQSYTQQIIIKIKLYIYEIITNYQNVNQIFKYSVLIFLDYLAVSADRYSSYLNFFSVRFLSRC